MIEQVTVSDWNDHEVVLAIDTDKVTDKTWEELSSFWGGHKERVRSGSCKEEMLKQLAELCLWLQVSNDYNSFGVMNAFTDGNYTEGWPKMDGSFGILIVHVDSVEFNCTVSSVVTELDKMPEAPKGNWQ
jgi:hypothetical protein